MKLSLPTSSAPRKLWDEVGWHFPWEGREIWDPHHRHWLGVALGVWSLSSPSSPPQRLRLCLRRMDDIQLCQEISRLKTELQKLLALPGEALGEL